jgi:hypothetical protein
VKGTDIILEKDFELLNKNILVDKKLYENNYREFVRYIWRIAMVAFTTITQGILVAGLSTYVNQIVKQNEKTE